MSNENLKQLIVLGNGFDLYCELRSSFNDFFTPRKKQLNKILEENIIKSQKLNELDNIDNVVTKWKEAGLTAWDIILSSPGLSRLTSESNWCDIESAIANFIQPSQQITEITDMLEQDDVDLLELSLKLRPDSDLLNKALEKKIVNHKTTRLYQPGTLENLLYNIFSQGAAYYLYRYMEYLKSCYKNPTETLNGIRRQAISSILLEELHILEQRFKGYLTREVKRCNR